MPLTFSFNGVDSSAYSVLISKKPSIPRAARNVEKYDIPGRHGQLTFDYGNFKPIQISVECSIADISDANLRAVRSWLTGAGDLIFSDENDKKWLARLDEQIDYTTAMLLFREFIIVFECFPLAYAVSNTAITKTTTPATFTSPTGASDGAPVIKVTATGCSGGSGNYVDLTLNGVVLRLTEITGSPAYVTIDSVLMDCYRLTVLKNAYVSGEFPMLINGTNNLSWTVGGTAVVTSVEIIPNWRWK